MTIPSNLSPKEKTSGASISKPNFNNMAIPMSDVGGPDDRSGTTFANNGMVGLAGNPVVPADVMAAAIQRRLTDTMTKTQKNMPNTGRDNTT